MKEIFWKTQVLFKKLEYRFVVESTKTGSAIFSYFGVSFEGAFYLEYP